MELLNQFKRQTRYISGRWNKTLVDKSAAWSLSSSLSLHFDSTFCCETSDKNSQLTWTLIARNFSNVKSENFIDRDVGLETIACIDPYTATRLETLHCVELLPIAAVIYGVCAAKGGSEFKL